MSMRKGDLIRVKPHLSSPLILWDNPFLSSQSGRWVYPNEILMILEVDTNPVEGLHGYQRMVMVYSREGFGWINTLFVEVIS